MKVGRFLDPAGKNNFVHGTPDMTVDQIEQNRSRDTAIGDFVTDFSIEVMPRTAAKIDDFNNLLPSNTRIYIAHIEGTPLDEMVATAKRLRAQGFSVMPHFPARGIKNRNELQRIAARYREEADVRQALVLAGGNDRPCGEFDRSIQLLESGVFDQVGYTHLHVAGHPEGNRDIDPDGSTRNSDMALWQKQVFANRTDASMAITTQFAFESAPVISWVERLKAEGLTLPVHVGVAGPARLQTLIKFALACGVGPSLRVLQRRAKDVRKLLHPIEPTSLVQDFAEYKSANPNSPVSGLHIFPLGGIKNSAEWAKKNCQNISKARSPGVTA